MDMLKFPTLPLELLHCLHLLNMSLNLPSTTRSASATCLGERSDGKDGGIGAAGGDDKGRECRAQEEGGGELWTIYGLLMRL